MNKVQWLLPALATSLSVAALPAQAQNGGFSLPPLTRTTAPAEPEAIPLYPAGAPALPRGAKAEIWDTIFGDLVVRNVVTPTITAYLPDPAKATGAAVVVAPGGGFVLLSIRNEGWDVGKWLADHGIAAFVLKYRVMPSPEDETEFGKFGAERMHGGPRPGQPIAPPTAFGPSVEDGIAAIGMVRARAAEWQVDPNRVGMIGFSAGAGNALAVTLANKPGARPDFIGLIYGSMDAVTPPADAPPLFAAMSADDPLFGDSGTGIIDSWRAIHRPAEFHLYQKGGHGFGMLQNGTTTMLWPSEFVAWLGMNGFLKARP